MNSDADADLREQFRGLREHDRAPAPTFESVLMRAPAHLRHGWSRRAWTAGGFALATVVGFFLILGQRQTAPDGSALALPPWPTQTDSLMASAGDSSQRLTWPPSPTSGLGQPSFNRYRENR